MDPIRQVWPKRIWVMYQLYTSFNISYGMPCASQKSILDPTQPKTENRRTDPACQKADTIATGCTASGKISLSDFLLNFNIRYICLLHTSHKSVLDQNQDQNWSGIIFWIIKVSWDDGTIASHVMGRQGHFMSYKKHHARKASIHSNWVTR
jgi:hypothetical protein